MKTSILCVGHDTKADKRKVELGVRGPGANRGEKWLEGRRGFTDAGTKLMGKRMKRNRFQSQK